GSRNGRSRASGPGPTARHNGIDSRRGAGNPKGRGSCSIQSSSPTDRNAAMKARRIALALLGAAVVAGSAGWFSLDKETRGLLATLPTNRDVLFWSQAQRDAGFRALDRLP